MVVDKERIITRFDADGHRVEDVDELDEIIEEAAELLRLIAEDMTKSEPYATGMKNNIQETEKYLRVMLNQE